MDDGPTLLTGTDVMHQVVGLLPRSGRVLAAVAYVTQDHLRLNGGDVLMVNAGSHAVEAGSTDPRLLLRLQRKGVVVISDPALHAKVVVKGDVAALGSANLSKRTSNLNEAMVVTTDPRLVGDAAAWIAIRAGAIAPISAADLQRLIALIPRNGGQDHEKWGPEKIADPFAPDKVKEILLWAWERVADNDDDFDPDAESPAGATDLDGYEWIPNVDWEESVEGQVWMRYERKLESPRRVVQAFSEYSSQDGSRMTRVGFDTTRKGLRPMPSWLRARYGREIRNRETIRIEDSNEIGELLGLWSRP